MKKFLLLSLAALFAMASCKNQNEQPSHVMLKLSSDTIVLNQTGKLSAQLKVTAPSNYATDKRLTWVSDNSCISVDQKGVITAVEPGKAVVTAFVNGLNAVRGTCVVIVSPASSATIELLTKSQTIDLGATIAIQYTYSEDLVGGEVELSSSDSVGNKLISYKIKEREETDTHDTILVTGLVAGKVNFTVANAYNPDVASSIELTVVETPITSFSWAAPFNRLAVGKKDILKVEILPEAASKTPIKWSVDDPSRATVDNKGVVTALAEGMVQVYATTKFHTVLTHDINIVAAEPEDPEESKEFAFADKTITLGIGVYNELASPIKFIVSPEGAATPMVAVIEDYKPANGVRSEITLNKVGGNYVVYAHAFTSCTGSAALVAFNGSKDEDGRLITDTCFVKVTDFSTNVLVAKAVYNAVDFGTKIAATAKFTSFIDQPITVKKVELIKTVDEEIEVVETLTPNKTVSKAEMEAFNFAPVACYAAEVGSYSIRYTIHVNNRTSVMTRKLVKDDGMAFVGRK